MSAEMAAVRLAVMAAANSAMAATADRKRRAAPVVRLGEIRQAVRAGSPEAPVRSGSGATAATGASGNTTRAVPAAGAAADITEAAGAEAAGRTDAVLPALVVVEAVDRRTSSRVLRTCTCGPAGEKRRVTVLS